MMNWQEVDREFNYKPASLHVCNSLPSFDRCLSCRIKMFGGRCRSCDSLAGVLIDRNNTKNLSESKGWGHKEILMSQCLQLFENRDDILEEIRSFVRSSKPRWLFLSGHSYD